jgi:hypothetical protein
MPAVTQCLTDFGWRIGELLFAYLANASANPRKVYRRFPAIQRGRHQFDFALTGRLG